MSKGLMGSRGMIVVYRLESAKTDKLYIHPESYEEFGLKRGMTREEVNTILIQDYKDRFGVDATVKEISNFG
jgi:hypothetical protein